MRRTGLLVAVWLTIGSCAMPVPSPTSNLTRTAAPVVSTIRPETWQIDVVNGARLVIVSINAPVDAEHPNAAGWAWLVPVGPTETLLLESGARPVIVDVIEPTTCEVLTRSEIPSGSSILVLTADVDGAGTLQLEVEYAAHGRGLARTDYHGGCSG